MLAEAWKKWKWLLEDSNTCRTWQKLSHMCYSIHFLNFAHAHCYPIPENFEYEENNFIFFRPLCNIELLKIVNTLLPCNFKRCNQTPKILFDRFKMHQSIRITAVLFTQCFRKKWMFQKIFQNYENNIFYEVISQFMKK